MSHVKNTLILVPVLRNSDSAKLPTAELKAHKDPRISNACILLLEELFKEQNCKTQFQLLEYLSKASVWAYSLPASARSTNPKEGSAKVRLSRAAAVGSPELWTGTQPSPALGSWPGIAAHPGTGYLLFPPIWTAPVWKTIREPLDCSKEGECEGTETQGTHRDISRNVLSHKWKAAVEPSPIAVLGNSTAPGTHPVLPWG